MRFPLLVMLIALAPALVRAQPGAPSILVLDLATMTQSAQGALSGLAYSYTLTSTEAEFNAALPTEDWDLVIVENPSQILMNPGPLAAYIDSAVGRTILSYWNAEDPAYASIVTDRMGGVPVTDVLTAQPLFCWDCSDGAWNRITPITSVPVGLQIWFDDGDEFDVTGSGVAVGGFGGPTPTPDRAGLIRANPTHLTYLVGISSDNMTPAGRLALWQNLIQTSLDTPGPACLPVSNLQGFSLSCTTDQVLLTWEVDWPGTTAIEIERNGVLIATIDDSEEQFLEVGVPDGTHVYTVRAICGGAAAPDETVVVEAVSLPPRNIVARLEGPDGMIDSATAIEDALDFLGEPWIEVDTLDEDLCYAPSTVIWVAGGTFPDARSLTDLEGTLLHDHLLAGGKVYFESGSHWEFDAGTDFDEVDGVLDFPSLDAQPGITSLNGLDSGIGWDSSVVGGATYSPDQGGGSTDRLFPAEDDVLGPVSAVSWRDGTDQFPVGTVYVGTNGARVVCQSWEFGGFGGSQTDLALRIISFLRGLELPCYPPHSLEVTRPCLSAGPAIHWSAPPIGTEPIEGYDIFRDGALIGSTSGGTEYIDLSAPLGFVAYEVRTRCAGGTVSATRSIVTDVTTGTPPDHIVLRLDYGGGLVDSATAIRTALENLGGLVAEYTSVDDIQCIGDSTVLWVVTGTHPDHYALDAATGSYLRSRIIGGGPVYFEGGDTWGFDPPTAFSSVDGVGSASDGTDGLLSLDGVDGHLPLEVFSGIPYMQDQVGNDSNDRLFLGITDELGANVTRTWERGPGPLEGVGVAYDTIASAGNVICQSWELGGFGGNLEDVIELYIFFLTSTPPPAEYLRGDSNIDGLVDLSDAVYTLQSLFGGGGFSTCVEAIDANADGAIDISDPIFTLAYLFVPGSPPIPAPYPDCELGPITPLGCILYVCP